MHVANKLIYGKSDTIYAAVAPKVIVDLKFGYQLLSVSKEIEWNRNDKIKTKKLFRRFSHNIPNITDNSLINRYPWRQTLPTPP